VKPLEFSCGPSLPAGGRDGIVLVAFVTSILTIPAAPWHPRMVIVICAIVVDRDVWVSASDPWFLKCHSEDQIFKMNSIVNTRFVHADYHSRRWGLRRLDLMLDYSTSV
jgi:hypothetical protein